jgi:hypothetical protein
MGMEPWAVHPQCLYTEFLEDGYEPGRVIVISVRHDHIMDGNVAAVVLMDVLHHILADAGVSAVHYVQIPRVLRAVLDEIASPSLSPTGKNSTAKAIGAPTPA